MAVYTYKAKTKEHQTLSGTLESVSLDAAADSLMEKGLAIIALREYRLPIWSRKVQPHRRVKSRDIVVFFRQLSVLISASVPIVQSMRVLTNQVSSPTLRRAIGEIANEVDAGAKLSVAMAKYPHVFSQLHRSLIQTGETSGKLDEIMDYLATQEENNYELMSRIKGSMAYPAVVVLLLLCVSVFVVVVIIPQLTQILTETGAELPLPTKILMGASDVIRSYWWAILIGLGVIIVSFVAAWRTPYGRWQFDNIILKTPIFGQLLQRVYLVRICRSLQTLIIGGVHVTRALTIVSGVVESPIYRQIIDSTVREVEDGNSITTVMARSPFIPPMVPQMMAIGEQTGKLDTILEKIADFYSREIDNLVRSMVSLIEPVVIIVIAMGIGFLLVAVLMPIYNATTSA